MRQILFVLLFSGFTARSQEILVAPYLQPGNVSTLSKELKVVMWQTDSVHGAYVVEFAPGNSLEQAKKLSVAKISSVQLRWAGRTSILYRAVLTGLQFDTEYAYRVRTGDKLLSAATFVTRTKKPVTRFVAFGDCGTGSPQQKAIAYQVSLQKPQFVLVTGDNVYSGGLGREYMARFFPVYNAPEAAPDKGAPLLKSVPFYMLVGNHDVQSSDLDKYPDGLAYFYYNDIPLNAPPTTLTVQATGQPQTVKAFEKAAGNRFPVGANYSFDYGNVHIVCLDANTYVNPLDADLLTWLNEDITGTRADWVIVSYHQPAFNSSKAHYNYQQMRLLTPVLEKLGVDLVLNGHIHNYQRTLPLTFEPKKDPAGERYIISPEGRVDGKFTLDQQFDGVTNTRPKGIIHVVSGAGGAGLYDTTLSGKPELWTHEPHDNWVPYTAKIVSDIHSFTVIETNGKSLVLQQMNAEGVVFDEIHLTKK
jgi:acid phosphatase type 7